MQYPQPNPAYPALAAVPPRSKHGPISALVLSFFSADLYRDVAQRWRGFGFWYLVLLLIVTWLPWGIVAHVGLQKFVRDDAKGALVGFPAVNITDGTATIDKPDPYIWRVANEPQPIFYFDSTGEFRDQSGADAAFKLSKHRLDIRRGPGQTQTYDLSQVKTFSVNKSDVVAFLDKASHFTALIIVGYALTVCLIYHLLQVLIFAAIGSAIASSMGARLSYGALMRLAIVALTPAMILSVALGFANLNPCGPFSLIYLIIEVVTFILAIKANAVIGGGGMPGGGFAAYPPGYGATPGGYPQQQQQGGYQVPPGYQPPPVGYPQQPGYGTPPPQFPPGPPQGR